MNYNEVWFTFQLFLDLFEAIAIYFTSTNTEFTPPTNYDKIYNITSKSSKIYIYIYQFWSTLYNKL